MVTACIPSRGLLHSRTIDDVLSNDPDRVIFSHGKDIPEAHNYLASQVEGGYLWFVDDDMLLPPDTLNRLLQANVDIALMNYPVSKGIPSVNVWDGEFMFGGLGCVLIHKSNLDKIGEFSTDFYYTYPKMEKRRNNNKKKHGLHDVHFFQRAKEEGLSIEVVGNVGQYYSEVAHVKGNNTSFDVEVWT